MPTTARSTPSRSCTYGSRMKVRGPLKRGPSDGSGGRWCTRRMMPLSALLQHREDVPGRILEPRDRRATVAHHALVVLREALVALERHAALGEAVDGDVDVV